MKEEKKRISLLTNLYDILFNGCISNNVFDYKFYSMSTLIINGTDFNVSGRVVRIILYLDELMIEVCTDEKCQNYGLPYSLIEDIHILLEE